MENEFFISLCYSDLFFFFLKKIDSLIANFVFSFESESLYFFRNWYMDGWIDLLIHNTRFFLFCKAV